MFRRALRPLLLPLAAAAYTVGDVDPRALRGVWRLTAPAGGLARGAHFAAGGGGETLLARPLKEFTTYPKQERPPDAASTTAAATHAVPTEVFIQLQDDHTFRQCAALSSSDGDGAASLEGQLRHELSRREKEWVRGVWDFVDGELILAADRPEEPPFSMYDTGARAGGGSGGADGADTIFVGRVAVQTEEGGARDDDDGAWVPEDAKGARASPKKAVDVSLSVPKGKIKTGKFMYPKSHPVSPPCRLCFALVNGATRVVCRNLKQK